jgi:hypothetical protein
MVDRDVFLGGGLEAVGAGQDARQLVGALVDGAAIASLTASGFRSSRRSATTSFWVCSVLATICQRCDPRASAPASR